MEYNVNAMEEEITDRVYTFREVVELFVNAGGTIIKDTTDEAGREIHIKFTGEIYPDERFYHLIIGTQFVANEDVYWQLFGTGVARNGYVKEKNLINTFKSNMVAWEEITKRLEEDFKKYKEMKKETEADSNKQGSN